MSRDYAEMERELIADLPRRTGKDLAGWMAAIDEARLGDKNAIIDWLRPKGFSFAHASWLERIHNNGGAPIYGDSAAGKIAEAARLMQKDATRPDDAPSPPPTVAPSPAQAHATPGPSVSQPDSDVEAVLAKGKAFRPLAAYLVAELRKHFPDATVAAGRGYISFAAGAEFAAVDVRPKEVRLGLSLGEGSAGALAKARIAGAGPEITCMLVLTDARQIDTTLVDLVRAARAKARS